MPAPVPLLPLHQLERGQLADCYALLIEKTPASTKTGKPYLLATFQDARRTVTCPVWSESPFLPDAADQWEPGTAYRLRVTYQEHPTFGAQIELHDWRPIRDGDVAAGFNLRQLVPSSRFDPEELWGELRLLVEKELSDPGLKALITLLLDRWADLLKVVPASEGRYYPFRGGWLEHTVSLAKSCLLLCDHYNRLYVGTEPRPHRDLVLAGAILHDLGRVLELKATRPGLPYAPTVPGRLFGHLILGRDLVRAAATECGNVAPEMLERLEHLILAHLTLPEWGSARLPLIPEVLILHHADDLDAKLEMYLRCLRHDRRPGPFTARDAILNKPLLKPGPWPEDRVPPPDGPA